VCWRRVEVLSGCAGVGHFLVCGVSLDTENSPHVPQNLLFGSLIFWEFWWSCKKQKSVPQVFIHMLSMPRYSHYYWLQSWPEGLFCVGLMGPSSPGTIQEGGALPLPGFHLVPVGQKGHKHLEPTIHATIIQKNSTMWSPVWWPLALVIGVWRPQTGPGWWNTGLRLLGYAAERLPRDNLLTFPTSQDMVCSLSPC
jgi:hypothetical protein